MLCLCIEFIHSMTGVAMVDCVIVIVYILHVWGPLELQLFFHSTMGYQKKATVTVCSWNLMVECNINKFFSNLKNRIEIGCQKSTQTSQRSKKYGKK